MSVLHPYVAWKDRPLQCPRCQSLNVGPWGTYHAQPGLQRYRCKEQGCKRTFNDLTGTLLDGSKRSVMHWILATFLLCLSCASRRIAQGKRNKKVAVKLLLSVLSVLRLDLCSPIHHSPSSL